MARPREAVGCRTLICRKADSGQLNDLATRPCAIFKRPQRHSSVTYQGHRRETRTPFRIEWAVMTSAQIRAAVRAAIESLRAEKPPLKFRTIHERSTAQRLAVHLEPHFRVTWNVDCEYDHDGQVRKTLEGIAGCGGRKTDYILPDIIVHRRGCEGRLNNLLVIEVKKNAAEDACDRKKLELLTRPDGHYHYQFGLYINVHGGKCTCTWYKDGKRFE